MQPQRTVTARAAVGPLALLLGFATGCPPVPLPFEELDLGQSVPAPSGGAVAFQRKVACIETTVSDLARAEAFYRDVLSFEPAARPEPGELDAPDSHHVTLELGDECLRLRAYGGAPGRPIPPDARSNDHAFQHIAIVVRDMAEAIATLEAHHVDLISEGPQRLPDWNPNAGGIEACYFHDPDRHALEVISFPPDKGKARWRKPTDALFLGIDHTAIVVSDTDASIAFFESELGFRQVGHSENFGVEQARLNHVPAAHLRITALALDDGPGVELLEYLAPRDGRPAPRDRRLSDIGHWHTEVRLGPGPARLREDPDGHAFLVSN